MTVSAADADCVVVGAGPAGLTAAIYLARFHLNTLVFDSGKSRAAMIPVSHNHAGFPEGISGYDLLARMREQAERYGAEIRQKQVDAIESGSGLFRISSAGDVFSARKVLLATGVVNRRPAMPSSEHDEALKRGLLRYCPVCDGFEVTDRRIAILGSGDRALREAQFLRSYSGDVSIVVPEGASALSPDIIHQCTEWGIGTFDEPCCGLRIFHDTISVTLGPEENRFDTVYVALGTDIRSGLAASLGARLAEEGCIITDKHQKTSVEGLYAAGDAVAGLDQISNAMGQAGVAATAIRNAICAEHPLRR